MSVCTFFGHRDCPEAVKTKLRAVLIELIEKQKVDTFYVGDSGGFDRIIRAVLRELVQKYPHIRYAVVLSRLPEKQAEDYSDTLLPEGVETVPPRFAISFRNEWMLSRADFVVTFVTHAWGGAAHFAEAAKRRRKTVINL